MTATSRESLDRGRGGAAVARAVGRGVDLGAGELPPSYCFAGASGVAGAAGGVAGALVAAGGAGVSVPLRVHIATAITTMTTAPTTYQKRLS